MHVSILLPFKFEDVSTRTHGQSGKKRELKMHSQISFLLLCIANIQAQTLHSNYVISINVHRKLTANPIFFCVSNQKSFQNLREQNRKRKFTSFCHRLVCN